MTESEVRQKIIQAAGPIFAKKGFDGATVREICRRAGVNVAAVNYYFGSKENLYRETVAAAHPAKFTQTPRYPSWPPGTPPEKKLQDFIATMLERVLQLDPHSWQDELLLREVLNPTPMCQSMIRHHFRAAMEHLRAICAELLPRDISEEDLLRTMLSIVAQCVYYRTARKVLMVVFGAEKFREVFAIDKLVRHITGFSLAALGVGPPVREWGGAGQSARSTSEVVCQGPRLPSAVLSSGPLSGEEVCSGLSTETNLGTEVSVNQSGEPRRVARETRRSGRKRAASAGRGVLVTGEA
ncbi:MAG: CerR family C-terminal domain-containing protein [Thermoguttaceae bacterium]|nr:CerR family C-terminal domain-containing protein [Thermoguttaceae bacterium]MDW8079554.1 CerR family C-terminal domain-containing protein [Thermoguttaceae bacterium]